MFNLLKLFSLLFFASVDDSSGAEESEVEESQESDEILDDLDTEEEEHEEVEETPAQKTVSRREKEIINLRERAQRAEDQHRQAMAELETARKQTQNGSAKPTHEQQLYEQEEAILKSAEATDWQKYSVQSARDARAALAESRNATRNAQDATDKAAFERIAQSKPKTFAAYKDKVETMLTDMRKNGNNAPREELMALLIGRDLIQGKVKAETKATKPAGELRGKTPGVRSDVSSGSGKLSDAEKRAKRLENVRI